MLTHQTYQPRRADVDSSLYLFCKEIKRDFVIGISGECADEIFAGYPWFKASAREEFMAMSACTMGIGRPEYWDAIVNKTAVEEVRNFLEGKPCKLVG